MPKTNKQPVVLTIAGLDPSGGAGILGDVKTISAFGCYGVAAITSVTFQTTREVFGASHQTAEILRQQIEPLFDDFEITAVKTGMLPTAEIVREVASIISTRAIPVVVVDPVLRSTSGFDLIDEDAMAAMTLHLLPLASLVTPNVEEASRLAGVVTRDEPGMERAGEIILRMGPCAVLITGSVADPDLSTDLLVDAQGPTVFSSERVESRQTHGTGCALASALACLLASGLSLRESVPIAKRYIQQAILAAPGLGHGHGPLNHFPPDFTTDG
jgi:hydroxymethylpyrimidine/phosphomethylpyrimidine kinase